MQSRAAEGPEHWLRAQLSFPALGHELSDAGDSDREIPPMPAHHGVADKGRRAAFSVAFALPRTSCVRGMRSEPPLDSIKMSAHQMPVLMWTEATLLMLMLISSLLNQERL